LPFLTAKIDFSLIFFRNFQDLSQTQSSLESLLMPTETALASVTPKVLPVVR
jgi:hypothetical protein